MELKQIVRVLIRWAWLAAIPVGVAALLTLASYSTPAVTYRVALRFATGSRPAEQLSADYDRYYAWLSSEYIANGLADVARTQVFAEAVVARLAGKGLELQPGAVQGALITDNVQSITVVELFWPDPAQAVAIAEAVGEELIEAAGTYYPQMDAVGAVARQLDTPVAVPQSPSLRSQLVGPGVRLGLAGVIGIGLAFLAHYLDPSVREKADLEALSIAVLASIPRSR